ncbi:GNAT family N-acetyltransferase [Aggregicoccus sp. 17bor-14]|uniref:GNAT family N-acetyltransferase n=1 Tax=Myxococcaceae TaxID=31 RepID=UPI00129C7688|nr:MULTISPECIES: GNAT family N-acetyltransferase [Myxococcaceae]MBF5046589.1 GNAT family N-acetyltransferase [Simulacricoccus sp. 17bor-14]MRI92300.1 GNAT family N-acetyltransferase [Aggregicoccus sp. 17bor-14]
MHPAFESAATERLLLRPFRETDLQVIFALHSDPETSRYRVSGTMRSLDDARALLGPWLEDWAERGVGYWAVARREAPGVVVGVGGVRHKELEGRPVLNLAYRLDPSTWGTGFATEVSRAAIDLARVHFPRIPVVAVIHLENASSIRVAERLGMRMDRVIDYEGTPHRVYVAD